MQDNEEGQKVRSFLIDIPSKQAGQDNGVSQAADGEEFSSALQDGDDKGLGKGHSCELTVVKFKVRRPLWLT